MSLTFPTRARRPPSPISWADRRISPSMGCSDSIRSSRRASCARWALRAPSAGRRCQRCRRSSKADFPISRTTPGPAWSLRPARRRISPLSCKARCRNGPNSLNSRAPRRNDGSRDSSPASGRVAEALKRAVFIRSAPMAIKYGRPIEARLAPVEAKIKRKPRLDLAKRPRRNRKAEWARRLVREHALTAHDLIWPLFLIDGSKTRAPVESMPGVERLSVDEAVREAERAAELAIPCLALFPYTDPQRRDQDGS